MTATENETLRDVMAEAVEIVGGLQRRRDGFHLNSRTNYLSFRDYSIGLIVSDSGVAILFLQRHGSDGDTVDATFEYADEAREEYDRLANLLRERETVEFMLSLHKDGILPDEFVPNVRSGDVGGLIVAADYLDDRDEGDKALLLRAAYYKATGQANITLKATKATTVIYNPQYVSRKHGVAKDGPLAVAVVTPGKSVRVVGLKRLSRTVGTPGAYRTEMYSEVVVKEYAIGSQAEHGSFNLVYYGPVLSITAKTVTIGHMNTSSSEKHRLDMATFVSKNYDFDLAKAQKRNSEWMD